MMTVIGGLSRLAGTVTVLFASSVSLAAQPVIVPPPPETGAIPLQTAREPSAAETWTRGADGRLTARNVTRPTLTPVLPERGKANGAAVIVAPGGAFMALAMDSEGFDVARALASRGFAAFVLKYRLNPTPVDPVEANQYMVQQIIKGAPDPLTMPTLGNPDATADGLKALETVRANADRWGVDRSRVGMIGFSAGAMVALQTALTADAAKRPAFIGYIYGPQAATDIPQDAPPLFDAIAFDDPLFPTVGFPLVGNWLKARRPVELHAYQKGGHGFGLGRPGTTTTMMLDEFVAWLSGQGFLATSNPTKGTK